MEMVSAKIVFMIRIFLKSSPVFRLKILKIVSDFFGHFQKNRPRKRAGFPKNRPRKKSEGGKKLQGSGRDLDVRGRVDDAVEAARGGALRLFGFGIYPAEGDIVT